MPEIRKFIPIQEIKPNGHRKDVVLFAGVGKSPTTPERKSPFPLVDSIREVQHIEGQSINVLIPDDNPELIIKHATEEMIELTDAIATGNRKEIASELPDVLLQIVRLSNYYQIPLDIAVSDKIARNAEKYPPLVVDKMREDDGIDTKEAMGILRGRWDKKRDFDEFCRSCGRPMG